MPRTTATTRSTAGRRFKPRDQANNVYSPLAPGHVTFGNFEPSGGGGTTLSMFQWIKFGQTAPASRCTASKFNYGTNNRSWSITTPNGNLLMILSNDGGVNWKRYQTYKHFDDGQWHPIGFVWNNGTLIICSDLDFLTPVNKLVDTSFTTVYQGNANVVLGSLMNGATYTNGWIGGLGPMVLSNEALTEDDWLNFVYDGVSPSGLELEALMLTGAGSTVLDTSGKGRDGAIQGNATWANDGPFGLRSAASSRTPIT